MTSTPEAIHLTDDQLVLLYYREPLETSGLDCHLAACAECLGRFETLSRVLHVVAQDEIPEPAGDFEERITAQVLSSARKPERGRLLRFPLRLSRTARFLAAGAGLVRLGRRLGSQTHRPLRIAAT